MASITLKNLEFSNMFSYGENNKISLNNNKITQLTAPNGSGKSSIAIILQETLFNKNIKSIKKADISNRYSNNTSWTSKLYFSVDDKDFSINIKRTGSKSEVYFYQESPEYVDLTEHKVLDTYKKIQETLNLDFEVFSQLTYQSSVDLLEFLKATDTNRKKFLINLFNLEKYVKIGETLKVKSNSLDKELAILQGELKSIEDFLNNTSISDKIQEVAVPETDEALIKELGAIETELRVYESTCKKIDVNNMYIQERKALKFDMAAKKPEGGQEFFNALEELKKDARSKDSDRKRLEKSLTQLDLTDTCYACGQHIDNSKAKELQRSLDKELLEVNISLDNLQKEIEYARDVYLSYKDDVQNYEANQKAIEKFEQLSQVIDETIPTNYPNFGDLETKKKNLEQQVKSQAEIKQKAIDHNQQVGIHNAKVDALIEQKESFSSRQHTIKNDIINLSNKVANLNVLKKAFSTSGIVAFKLENLTKELELAINRYLASLSDGQFQVSFKLDKEKLNIIVSNNGVDTPIETVSGGEFSRIQTAILLAIRSLLAKLGGSSVNLLFLDEITGVLDDEGKEKLIEVLREEDNLNVFLISHDFTHPLIDKVSIIKQNNISSIQ